MRKYKFITGTVSLTLAAAIGAGCLSQGNGRGYEEVLVCEYETVTSDEVVEKSANEVNVLMDAGNFMVEETANQLQCISIKNNETESESKETTEKKAKNKKEKTKKKNTKKSNKNTKKSKSNDSTNLGTYKITAYCSCSYCCGKSNGITASGTKAKAGRTIAADTSVLPFGTKVVIDGHTYTVEDRGGAIRGNKIDVYCSSHSEALKWGVKYCNVYVK